MLDVYVKNYLQSLGTGAADAGRIAPEADGTYTLSFDDRILITLCEASDDPAAVSLRVVLAPPSDWPPEATVPDLYAHYEKRWSRTPFCGRARAFVDLPTGSFGLICRLSLSDLEQADFNAIVSTFGRCALCTQEGSALDLPDGNPFAAPDDDGDFQRLLAQMGVSAGDLSASLNRLELEDFAVLLKYDPHANLLWLINALDPAPAAAAIPELLALNATLDLPVGIVCRQGTIYIEQPLDLKTADPGSFRAALSLQRQFIAAVRENLAAADPAPGPGPDPLTAV